MHKKLVYKNTPRKKLEFERKTLDELRRALSGVTWGDVIKRLPFKNEWSLHAFRRVGVLFVPGLGVYLNVPHIAIVAQGQFVVLKRLTNAPAWIHSHNLKAGELPWHSVGAFWWGGATRPFNYYNVNLELDDLVIQDE